MARRALESQRDDDGRRHDCYRGYDARRVITSQLRVCLLAFLARALDDLGAFFAAARFVGDLAFVVARFVGDVVFVVFVRADKKAPRLGAIWITCSGTGGSDMKFCR